MTIADIQTLTNFLIGGGTNQLSNANFLIILNNAYERITARLIKATSSEVWPYGDANYSSFPTYTMNLVNGQQSYALSSLSTTPLYIFGAEFLDQLGIWQLLIPINFQDIRKQGFANPQFFNTSGKPYYYEKREWLINLYPPPDNGVSVTLTNGLRIYYLRTSANFTEAERATGTKTPGFPSPFHDILAYETAYLFAAAKTMENAAYLKSEVDRKEKQLLDFISGRNQDDLPILTMKPIDPR